MANFYEDREAARGAEVLTWQCLAQLSDKYVFNLVADDPEYYYKGDIIALDKETGKAIYIEVKNDSRIAQTRNVLCEEKVWYDYRNDYGAGNMHCASDIYCVVSQ